MSLSVIPPFVLDGDSLIVLEKDRVWSCIGGCCGSFEAASKASLGLSALEVDGSFVVLLERGVLYGFRTAGFGSAGLGSPRGGGGRRCVPDVAAGVS